MLRIYWTDERIFLPPACIWVGVGHLCAPGRVLMCKCRSVQEWSLTKCKRLHRGHKHASTLSLGFVHIVHMVCAHCAFYFCPCAFQQIFIDGQLIMLHFVSLFVCPQAQQNLDLGQLQWAALILVSTAAAAAAAQQQRRRSSTETFDPSQCLIKL